MTLIIVFLYIVISGQFLALRDSLNLVQCQIDSLQQKIEEIEQILNNIESREQKSLQRLELIQEKISLTQKMLKQVAYQIEYHNREIAALNNELAKLLQQQKICQNRLRERLIAIYRYSKIYQLQALLTSTNLPEYYRRMINLQIVSRNDRRLLEELKEINSQLKAKQREIVTAINYQEKMRAEYELKKNILLKDREQEASILSQIRREKTTQQLLQQELQNASNQLRNLLNELSKRVTSAETSLFEKKHGNLPWPVKGTVISQFGIQTHPRYRTKVNYPGIDIKVKQESPVFVVADGKIVYADRFVGYGNLVIIDHGSGYFTLYGNLTAINTVVNATVSAKSVIGTVDDYLHFEIRKDGQPLDPKDWLQ